MKITDREVTLFLDDDGRAVMGLAALDTHYPVYIKETDDMGLWARIQRQDGEHTVLIRWEYVLTMDFSTAVRKVGLES